MATTLVRPTGVERTFGADELIVSKTDPRGIIRYANETFCQISRYPEDRLLGQPHNIVRHPETPRVLFKLLWDTISSGREMFAYLANLAADGAHYWVFAHVSPTFGKSGEIIGYHSNRRSPARSALEPIQRLYADLRAAERQQPSGPAQLAAGERLLERSLAELGCDYDRFVWSITPAEIPPSRPGALR